MLIHRSGLIFVLALASAGPGSVWAQKLDNDDKKFLNDVRPLLTEAEEATFKRIKEKADRVEFQKIFWARRDPDLATPENEAKEQYEKDRAAADLAYRVPGMIGSQTDCGRVFILLGQPDDVESEGGSIGGALREPETWIYKDRPGRTFQGGRAAIAFDAECRGVAGLAAQLDRVAAAKVTQPNIEYRFGKNNRLVPLVELLPKDTAVRQLFKTPRTDFAVAAEASFLKVAGGGTALVGVLQGDAAGLPVSDSPNGKVVNLSVAASAVDENGREAAWTEQTVLAPIGADGKFTGTYKMGLTPGKYTLRAGAVDVKAGKGSLTTLPVVVPDLSQVVLAADGTAKPQISATAIVVRQIQEVPANAPDDPADPFAAYRLAGARLIPVLASALRQSDTVSFFFQVYDYQLDEAGKAKGTARLKIMAEGRGLVTSSQDVQVDTPIYGTEIGPVSLEKFAPGKYLARVEATDKIAQRTITFDAPFEILP